MPYLLAILLVAVIAVFVGLSSARPQATPTKTTSTVERREAGRTARSRLNGRLDVLAQVDPSEGVGESAMCYAPAEMPLNAAYVCPRCGEKTLYSTAPEEATTREYAKIGVISGEIPACRRLVKSIEDLKTEGLKIALDESQFCAKCSPDLKEPPKLVLVVHREGEEKPHRVEGVTPDDLRLIQEYLSGQDKHKGEGDKETPLKDHVERLRQLLGTEIEEPVEQETDNDE